jgi:uncharacterized membrane protein required for colicin V production
MTIWLLALLLMACVAGVGYRQGGVRAAFSLVGILLGALLAKPLGKLLKPVMVAVGVKYPPLAWLLGALVVFVVISIIFKVAAFMVHQKVDVYYKYHTGDLRLVLWERLNRRLGLCLGLVNGALYCILIAAVIYPFSYWTFQFATPDKDPKSLTILNRLGQDLQSTGFAKVARAADPMPQVWYDSADLAALIYNNPLSEARLARYPAFLGLAERQEFQDIASDTKFTEDRLKRMPIADVVNHPKIQAILNNPDLLHVIWTTVVPDMKDLTAYLDSGKSAKYDPERILGRWNFDVSVALTLYLRTKQNISSREMQKIKEWYVASFSKTSFVAKTDHKATLKNLPPVRSPVAGAAAASGPQTLQGQWQDLDGKYQIAVTIGDKEANLAATVEADRLTITGEGMNLVFSRED